MGLIGFIVLTGSISPLHDSSGKKKKLALGNERASNIILPSFLHKNHR